ncbi:hypothetical protein PR048_000050 [Dryococelus australis]|uniref:Platelet-derived growth factor (PDGF) family profile domain-containing protein n=1 Tax=Dryococelus australis TaxID=614101 RepID=A0ABQ9IFR3_9NEOP|nr:hypothetical protein PR048_000050 [Dryococelus australis]
MCRGLVAGWALLLALLCAGAEHERSREAMLRSHLARVHEFSCHEPQPRALEAEPLVNARSDEHVLPPSTVLHRCKDAGCCGARQVCAPLNSTPITLWFNVSSTVSRMWDMRSAEVLNHTHCSCQDFSELRR